MFNFILYCFIKREKIRIIKRLIELCDEEQALRKYY